MEEHSFILFYLPKKAKKVQSAYHNQMGELSSGKVHSCPKYLGI